MSESLSRTPINSFNILNNYVNYEDFRTCVIALKYLITTCPLLKFLCLIFERIIVSSLLDPSDPHI